MTAADDLPDYLVEVVAKKAFLLGRVEPKGWNNLDEATRRGYRRTARIIPLSRAAQSDIKQ